MQILLRLLQTLFRTQSFVKICDIVCLGGIGSWSFDVTSGPPFFIGLVETLLNLLILRKLCQNCNVES